MAGRFITLEGGEGAGKSTQARRLADRLRAQGRAVILTREPGGTPLADAVRALLLDPGLARGPLAEALLFNAARADHVERVIGPALAEDRWVVCDRFADSTRAYQGAAGGVAEASLVALERMVVGTSRPDLTLVLDLEPALGLARARARGTLPGARGHSDAFEARELAFHERLRAGFLAIARAEPARCAVIDAAGAPDDVAARIAAAVAQRLGSDGRGPR